jgi:hypothetical protein
MQRRDVDEGEHYFGVGCWKASKTVTKKEQAQIGKEGNGGTTNAK